MSDWQPIETAPMDGSHILMAFPATKDYPACAAVVVWEGPLLGWCEVTRGESIPGNEGHFWQLVPEIPEPPNE